MCATVALRRFVCALRIYLGDPAGSLLVLGIGTADATNRGLRKSRKESVRT
jgi:hypothetical protein